MRKTLLIITALMLMVGCSSDPFDGNKLVERGGLFYQINSDEPYSGEAVWYYDNEYTHRVGNYKDGKWDGKWTYWHKNGQKRSVGALDPKIEWGDDIKKMFKEIHKKFKDKDFDSIKDNIYPIAAVIHERGHVYRRNIEFIIDGIKNPTARGSTDNGFNEEALKIIINNSHHFSPIKEYPIFNMIKRGLEEESDDLDPEEKFFFNFLVEKEKDIYMLTNQSVDPSLVNKYATSIMVYRNKGEFKLLWWKEMLRVAAFYNDIYRYFESKNSDELEEKDGVVYTRNTNESYSGPSYSLYGNGQKQGEGTFKNGKKNGKWTSWHDENGQKKSEGTYRNGNLIGKYEKWFKNGTKKWEVYNNDDGTRDSTKLTIQWYENGQKQFEGYWKNTDDTAGVWIGKYTEWHKNGQKKNEGTFKDGEKDGKWSGWHENGQKKYEETHKDGELDGKYISWDENGQKWSEETYKNGELNGKVTGWYENGEKEWEETYQDGELVKSTGWYENRRKKEEGPLKLVERETYTEWVKYGKWTYWYEDGREIIPIIPKFVMVRGGTFQMGSNSGDDDEKPVHSVTVSDFSMSKTEVTFEQYDVFCTLTSRDKPDDEGWGRGDRPVIKVSWHDAVAFCEWISTQTDKTVRLPTEAEWEYAARGGNKSKGYTYSGNKDLNAVGWYSDNCVDKTHPVAQKQPNELGLYDMSGNVFEWCSDRYSDYGSSQQTDPEGPTSGSFRILRGGSWFSYGNDCRVTNRGVITSGRSYGLGFRCVSSAQ